MKFWKFVLGKIDKFVPIAITLSLLQSRYLRLMGVLCSVSKADNSNGGFTFLVQSPIYSKTHKVKKLQ